MPCEWVQGRPEGPGTREQDIGISKAKYRGLGMGSSHWGSMSIWTLAAKKGHKKLKTAGFLLGGFFVVVFPWLFTDQVGTSLKSVQLRIWELITSNNLAVKADDGESFFFFVEESTHWSIYLDFIESGSSDCSCKAKFHSCRTVGIPIAFIADLDGRKWAG